MAKDGYTMLFSFNPWRIMLLGSSPIVGPLVCLNLFLVFICFRYTSLDQVCCKQDLLWKHVVYFVGWFDVGRSKLKWSRYEVACWCKMIFTFIFDKNENKENINNNIKGALLDQNFIRSRTLEVQTERLSRFLLIVNFILGFFI